MENYQKKIGKADDIPLVTGTQVEVAGKKTNYYAVVEEGSNDTLGIHTQYYNIAQNKELYDVIAGIKDVQIEKAILYLHGKVMMVEISQKNEKGITPTGDKKDIFMPKTRIFNSYDGSRSITIQAYALRLVCSNGMVAPVKQNVLRKIHLGEKITPEIIKEAIKETANIWSLSKELIKQSTSFGINSELALFYLGRFPQKYQKIALENLEENDTIYNIWNELTRIMSHIMESRVNSNVLISQQQKVNKIFNLMNMNETQIKTLQKELKEYKEKELTA